MANIKKYILKPYFYERKHELYDEMYNKVYGDMFACVDDILIVAVEMVDINVNHLTNTGKLHLYFADAVDPVLILDCSFETTIDLSNFKAGKYYIKIFVYDDDVAFSSTEVLLKVGR